MRFPRRHRVLCLLLVLAGILILPPGASAQSNGGISADQPSAAAPASPPPPARTARARIVRGLAVPPRGAPPAVVEAIEAANRIATKPYRYGGGHAKREDTGYDCSGAVSYALAGAGLLESALPSGALMNWGDSGRGRWITVYSNPGHAFVVIAGLRFDTGYRTTVAAQRGAAPGRGPRWDIRRSTRGFVARHPAGL